MACPLCLSIHCFHRRPNQFHQLGKFFLRAGLPVDRDSLFDPVEMGRGEQSGAIAGRREHGRHHRRRRALAFGARHVNDRHAVLRVAQPAEQFPHPVELERLFRARHRLGTLVVDPIGEEPQGGLGGGTVWSAAIDRRVLCTGPSVMAWCSCATPTTSGDESPHSRTYFTADVPICRRMAPHPSLDGKSRAA